MAYIGSTPTTQSFISGTDYFNGTGSQTSFTLSRSVGSVNDIEAVVNNVVQRPNDAYNISGNNIVFTSAPSAGTSNIYVRYLSTTTQSITPSQNTVSYATWNSDLRNETWAFRNRIINGDMSIDQRNAGASVTPTNQQYSIDRWLCFVSAASKYTVQQNAGSVTPPAGFINYLGITSSSAYSVGAGEVFGIEQRIEGVNTSDLSWGTANAATVTLSFWVRSSLTGTFGGAIRNNANNRSYPFSYTVSSANTWTSVSVTIPGDTSGTWVTTTAGSGIKVTFSIGTGSTYSGTAGAWAGSEFYSTTGATSVVGTSGATFYITGVQLEKGFTATNFDVLPYGTELMLCQRYYQRYQATAAYTPILFQGRVRLSNSFTGVVTLPVVMRASPTLTATNSSNAWYIATAGDLNANTIFMETSGPSVVALSAGVSGAVAGQGGVVYPVANGTYFDLSAEL